MKLSIISLNYKRSHLTVACMASLWDHYKKEFENGEFEYIVIDNFSQDESFEVLKKESKKYKNFHVLENKKNTGFGGGNNEAVKSAKGEYLLFLNNDAVVENQGIGNMLSYAKSHPEVGAVGGRIQNGDGSEQASTGNFYSLFSITLYLLGLQRFGFVDKNPKNTQEVDWVKGALMMVKKDVFEKVGGFDEHIFMYTEDMEFCYRLRQAGLQCMFFSDIVIKHKDQGSTNRAFAIVHIYASLPYFYKKHTSLLMYWYVKTLLQLKAYALIGIGTILHNTYLTNTYRKALQSIG